MKKLWILLMVVLMSLSLTGCGSDNSGKTDEGKVLRFNLGYEPDTLDPQLSNNLESGIIMTQLYDTLLREQPDGTFKPSLAESFTESEDGLVYTFKLRSGMKFSSGNPITAEDVVYSWTRALDPRIAAEYAYQLYYIKGAEALNATDPADTAALDASLAGLGVKAIDELTVEVTLDHPTPYFSSLVGFVTYAVVDKKFIEATPEYGKDIKSSAAYSGPYVMKEWKRKEYVVLEKNVNYWDAGNVKLDQIYIYAVNSSPTEITMFETDQIDVTYFAMASADADRLQKAGLLKSADNLMTNYVTINTLRKPLDDVRVRQALLLALDRDALASQVMKKGAVAVDGLIPPGMPDPADLTKKFRTESLVSTTKADVPAAQKLLADAGYPNGEGFPVFEVIYTTSESTKAIAEAMSEMWKANLNIDVKTQNMEGTVRRDKRQQKDFDMTLNGWSVDYIDPYSFLEICTTGNVYNEGSYSNAEYDRLVAASKEERDPVKRSQLLKDAEKIVVEEVGVLAYASSPRVYLEKEGVSGIIRSPLGLIDFKYADINK